MKKKLLVFPCGSEVALEIHRSLRFSAHFELVGASSVDDHGKFVFEKYIGGIPFHNHPDFISVVKGIVQREQVDAIFPAMDAVATTLKSNESTLGCVVIGSGADTTAVCSSKSATYSRLSDCIPCPAWANELSRVEQYPVFIKPDEGYGSRNVGIANSRESAEKFLQDHPGTSFVFCEYLPGEEFTVDCFSSSKGELLFHGARKRARVSNGISVNTVESSKHKEAIYKAAMAINDRLQPRGAWFFQMKENKDGDPVLLEVAARLGGSSSYFRAKGVNFALLSAFDAFDISVKVEPNTYDVELDRALGSRYRIDLTYDTVFIDFDDCLLLDNKVNTELVKYIFQARNQGVAVVLITRHEKDIFQTLKEYRLEGMFDQVIHIKDKRPKSEFITKKHSIFIDDSFAERAEVKRTHGIPVFSPDMVEMLMISEG
ncbi:ATP-grasp domain-containing protein [Marinobacter sp. NP-4(2019)]|uniref:ATP-grasp domain-containing protein n=1 Tax=Marinobacter sp. NP-4(2019) TaxID=2488665 RepID=UPI000FC3E52E|nr:ATP-grasp domain-containing protein [Marinobacter sp. NP-4(2019)]AZT84533.1 ATP-grasp domain-containing protein [Marinobacter sp. NP-4(2019)]